MLKSVFNSLFFDLIDWFKHKGNDVDVTGFVNEIHVLDISTHDWYDSNCIRFCLK